MAMLNAKSFSNFSLEASVIRSVDDFCVEELHTCFSLVHSYWMSETSYNLLLRYNGKQFSFV